MLRMLLISERTQPTTKERHLDVRQSFKTQNQKYLNSRCTLKSSCRKQMEKQLKSNPAWHPCVTPGRTCPWLPSWLLFYPAPSSPSGGRACPQWSQSALHFHDPKMLSAHSRQQLPAPCHRDGRRQQEL